MTNVPFHFTGVLAVIVILSGCATPATHYRITASVPDVKIYRSCTDNDCDKYYYTKTPFETVTDNSLGWSGDAFYAEKEGYETMQHIQPFSSMGTPNLIHFTMKPLTAKQSHGPIHTPEDYHDNKSGPASTAVQKGDVHPIQEREKEMVPNPEYEQLSQDLAQAKQDLEEFEDEATRDAAIYAVSNMGLRGMAAANALAGSMQKGFANDARKRDLEEKISDIERELINTGKYVEE